VSAAGDVVAERPLHVVHIIPVHESESSPAFHGAENHLFTLIEGQRQEGLRVDLILLSFADGPRIRAKVEELRAAGVSTVVIAVPPRRRWSYATPQRGVLRILNAVFRDSAVVLAVSRELRKRRDAVVHTHLDYADLVGQIAAFLARCRTRVSSNHNNEPHYRERRWWVQLRLLRLLISRYIAVSRVVRDHLVECAGIGAERISIVHYGIAVPRRRPRAALREQLGIPADEFVVGFVGRLEEQKNLQTLLDAFSGLPAAIRCVIVGEGTQRPALERRIEAEGLTNVVLVGYRPDARELIPAFDRLCLPSRWEGFGLVLVEAMLQGVPVIAANAGAIPELLQRGRFGVLFDPDRPDDLREAILQAFREPAPGARAADAARDAALRRFTVARMVRETTAVYAAALAGR
jgi:glycosyltransferase involved in cell wall biosynthesis